MQGSAPQTFTIAEFLKWNDDDELNLNPIFQRGPVWSPPARSYLIDSIIRGYPIPKLLLRTNIDRDTRRTIRDVVDGQQRLRTIIAFAAGKFALTAKAGEYKGKRYADLSGEEKDNFLAYKLTCEQLINASDDDVLEVFLRINSYAVPVNGPELRNARFDTDFSSHVKQLSHTVREVWSLGVISPRERVRMVDHSTVAELIGYLINGVGEGADSNITRLYEQQMTTIAAELPGEDLFVDIISTVEDLLQEFRGEAIVGRPHFLMLAAAVMYAKGKLPEGRLDFTRVEDASKMLRDRTQIIKAIGDLNTAIETPAEDLDPRALPFIEARSSSQRMPSRQTRFEYFCHALAGKSFYDL
ncbi:DUF262 domain-containing protein [Streptomyces sp. MNU89]|uniref:DUF262 domain-containing protein n=1 Tax=Streptomyces sp. MNU89 TaxID=2560025 RepID=UPI001E37D10E|nr:DUF262 domain-containing protein [Streptomyces sp. MNU89]MCC9740393.1 DUF262 domain-containing protein [Streptomyces sp. MNU89]